jgi:DNA-directed RNA polymerase subunit RPC12/RpoP
MCHVCPKIFPSWSALKEHLYSHMAESEQKRCTECGKCLKNDSTLRSHMKSHGSQLYRCPHCSKVYNFPQSLRAHMRSHSNTHPYKCLVCGKTFKLKKGLKVSICHHYFLLYAPSINFSLFLLLFSFIIFLIFSILPQVFCLAGLSLYDLALMHRIIFDFASYMFILMVFLILLYKF